ncbi:EAL domain-containing protein [Aurantimonas sp. MSK8Z-1]|uniref:putative bifunctional diguanylate cyclase/phosphodiesterase n=1 Tax=Mangrovibrevibacter kandeliae TaxID=2968473 RepID=UPI002118B383|nr:EAL domain-containing protein [Aurantimonas sp. MSK8Z-1]MCW4113772.1 EAL domain-containing protein [Aurantimonas sp. MSK8Z-1]
MTTVLPEHRPELLKAQAVAFTRQVPLMYFILVASTLGVAVTHFNTAPIALTLIFPSVLCALCLFRLFGWHRRRNQPDGDAEAVRLLQRTMPLAVVFGVGFTGWALSLYPYGNAYAQAHVAFYMAITIIGCIFCLMHHREAALILTVVSVLPMAIFFASTGNPVFIAISVNTLLVAVAIVYVVLQQFRDFQALVSSRLTLEARQAETERLSGENFRLANLDGLTGLPNRRHFFAHLEKVTARAQASGTRFAVGVFDLDGFKPVNDAYGHVAGDRVLVETGRRLSGAGGDGIFVARLGGDEYGIVIERDICDADLAALGASLCDSLREPYVMPGFAARVSGSLGLATFPEAAPTAELLYERADYALYFAKENGRGAPAIFSQEHENKIRQSSRIEQALRHADLKRELELAFQPIVDTETGNTISFEALARWTSPTLGRVSPADFIPVAERSGLVTQLTPMLLKQALATAQQWPEPIHLSFNLSTMDLASDDQVSTLIAIIQEGGFPPARIDLEITETAVMRDFDQATRSLRRLKELGVGLALDDFGTGQSSLSYVHRLPLQKLKIDRSFVIGLAQHGTSRDVVKTIVDLCRNLALNCVVEGVESPEQLLMLRALGCRAVQGYLFARPMPSNEIAGYLAGARDRHAKGPVPTAVAPDEAAMPLASRAIW